MTKGISERHRRYPQRRRHSRRVAIIGGSGGIDTSIFTVDDVKQGAISVGMRPPYLAGDLHIDYTFVFEEPPPLGVRADVQDEVIVTVAREDTPEVIAGKIQAAMDAKPGIAATLASPTSVAIATETGTDDILALAHRWTATAGLLAAAPAPEAAKKTKTKKVA